jgi:hypothetical protein
VLVGTVYALDEKTTRKAALRQLTVRPVDQNRLLIRRTARRARSAMAFSGSARTIAISRGGLNRMAASAAPARAPRRAINLKGPGQPGRLIFVSVLVGTTGGFTSRIGWRRPVRWRRVAIQAFASSFKPQGSPRSLNWAAVGSVARFKLALTRCALCVSPGTVETFV